MPSFQEGQRVNYKPVGGPNSNTSTSTGVIREVATEPTTLTGRSVAASDKEPRYQLRELSRMYDESVDLTCLEIENEKTRKSSAVKEANIIGPAE
ncbi:uncharacterized protein N7484_006348 [Penicillium longicatenatum]|uniref:uncharacterized protein n=1 Tax=Penicillium longicatenatum TaxID=1561947 RepID=UPI002549033A|nr:uncharacterized protein N7484_006348 [Penicillium longicatenatum]KAJ5643841.1 hypothetical protein N7484_006348 [Penicillium longicatenatum]